MEALQRSLFQVISAAEYSATVGAELVVLTLSFSAIDALGWLAVDGPEATRASFMDWVTAFMLPAVPTLNCTAEELYATRCGILHTLTPDSQLQRSKGLRRLAYAWGSSDAPTLQKRIDERGLSASLVVVHLADLTAGVRLGAAAHFERALSDAALGRRLEVKGTKFMGAISPDDLK